MRAGHLKKVIGIEKFTITLDTYGEEVVSYTPLQNVRASINPISGNEKYMNSQLINEVSHKIEIRYNPNLALNPKDRIVFNSRNFDIINILNWNEKNDMLIILCTEVL